MYTLPILIEVYELPSFEFKLKSTTIEEVNEDIEEYTEENETFELSDDPLFDDSLIKNINIDLDKDSKF
jgi:hypothetical protein